jgi:predicted Zn-dependent protease
MAVMLRVLPLLLLVALAGSACALLPEPVPTGAYTGAAGAPHTVTLAQTLYRAVQAADDYPARYAFALVRTANVTALATDNTSFYFSDGLARQPAPATDSLVAHAVAHEVLGHGGKRRRLSLGISAGFTAIGIVVPGLSLLDFVVNPLVIRAYNRDQNLRADAKAVEILRRMGHDDPKRTLARPFSPPPASTAAPSRASWKAG